jgi:hypothetical protein
MAAPAEEILVEEIPPDELADTSGSGEPGESGDVTGAGFEASGEPSADSGEDP